MATPPRKASTGQLNSNTHCSLWSVHTRKQSNSLAVSSISEKVGTRCRSPCYERFVEGCSSPFLRPRRTPHGASRLVRAMPACLVKTRRAPSRHSKEARVYGHTTTVMHNLSTPPPPSPSREFQSGSLLDNGERTNAQRIVDIFPWSPFYFRVPPMFWSKLGAGTSSDLVILRAVGLRAEFDGGSCTFRVYFSLRFRNGCQFQDACCRSKCFFLVLSFTASVSPAVGGVVSQDQLPVTFLYDSHRLMLLWQFVVVLLYSYC